MMRPETDVRNADVGISGQAAAGRSQTETTCQFALLVGLATRADLEPLM